MNKERFSIVRRVQSVKYAFSGIFSLLANEHNAWIHSVAAIAVVLCGILLKIRFIEWIVVLFSIALVFIAELINTAIEQICNAITTKNDKRIKQAKDMGAGAVLIAAIAAAIAGTVIFLPKLLALLQQ